MIRMREKGFTLIELMVVIVILGVLATLVVPKLIGAEQKARATAAKAQIKTFKGCLERFRLDNQFYPSTEQGLEALVKMPTVGREPPQWDPEGYIERIPPDPWRNGYIYYSPGKQGEAYEIICLGRDGQTGGTGYDVDISSNDL